MQEHDRPQPLPATPDPPIDRPFEPGPGGRRGGAAALGALLVAAGVALLLARAGTLPAPWRTGIWPVLLAGYGLVRLSEPSPHGREGLFFVLAGVWWLAVLAGWLSPVSSWPMLFVALGLSLVVQAFTASEVDRGPLRRRPSRAGRPWLLLAIFGGAVLASGLGPLSSDGAWTADRGALHVRTLGSRATRTVSGAVPPKGDVVTVMGRAVVDLREASVAPGETVTLHIFSLMSRTVIHAPADWTIDVEVTPVFGAVHDQREPRTSASESWQYGSGSAAAAPHLVLRGSVMMGQLSVEP